MYQVFNRLPHTSSSQSSHCNVSKCKSDHATLTLCLLPVLPKIEWKILQWPVRHSLICPPTWLHLWLHVLSSVHSSHLHLGQLCTWELPSMSCFRALALPDLPSLTTWLFDITLSKQPIQNRYPTHIHRSWQFPILLSYLSSHHLFPLGMFCSFCLLHVCFLS